MHIAGEQLEIGSHRIASQQILNVDRPEIAYLDMTRGDLFQRGQRLHHHGIGLEQADGEAALAAQC